MAHQITSEGGANLAPAAPAQIGAEGGASLGPAAPAQIADRGTASYGTLDLILVSGVLSPDAAGILAYAETDLNGRKVHTSNGLTSANGSYPYTRLYGESNDGIWILEHLPSGESGDWRQWHATLTSDALDADDWAPSAFNPPDGTPVLSAYPAALAAITAEGGASLAPAAPAQIGAEGGASLAPAAPAQITGETIY